MAYKKGLVLFILVLVLTLSLSSQLSHAQYRKKILIWGFIDKESYPRFYELLENNGYEIEFLNYMDVIFDLTYEDMKKYDVIFLIDLAPDLFPEETRRDLLRYVKSGKGLMILCYPFEEEQFFEAVYKVNYINATFIDEKYYADFEDTPIYDKISFPFNYSARKVIIPSAYVLAIQPNSNAKPAIIVNNSTHPTLDELGLSSDYTLTPIAFVEEENMGHIVFIGSVMLFHNMMIFKEDNAQFILNIFHWLSRTGLTKVDISFQINRANYFITLGMIFMIIGGIAIILSKRIPLYEDKLYRLTIAILSIIFCLYLLAIVGTYYHYISTIQATEAEALSLWLIYMKVNVMMTPIYLLLILLVVYLHKRTIPHLRDNMYKLLIGDVIGSAIVCLYLAYFWYVNVSSNIIEEVIPMTLGFYTVMAIPWIGIPFLWLLLRKQFEKYIIRPHLNQLSFNPVTYVNLFHIELYSKFIYILYAVLLLSYRLPSIVLVLYDQLLGRSILLENYSDIIRINSFLVMALAAAIFMLRRTPRYGLKNREELNKVNQILFTREIPYFLILLYVIPVLLRFVVGLQVQIEKIAYVFIGIFIGYLVGYGLLWLYFTGLKTALATVTTTVILIGYQWIVENMLIKTVTSIVEKTAYSSILAIAIAVAMKQTLGDFLKSITIKPKPKPKTKKERIEELKVLIENLDKALVEGRITEELYKELKTKYTLEIQKLESENQ